MGHNKGCYALLDNKDTISTLLNDKIFKMDWVKMDMLRIYKKNNVSELTQANIDNFKKKVRKILIALKKTNFFIDESSIETDVVLDLFPHKSLLVESYSGGYISLVLLPHRVFNKMHT